jgi:NADH dehydrogenase
MHVRKVCVLGGTGFVGSHLVGQLIASGREVMVPTRRIQRHRDLLVFPGVRLVEADVHDPRVLKQHFQGMDAVINLVGILNEKGHDGRGFRRAHVDLARSVLEACKATGVTRLLHMSALHADAGSGPSHYLRSKGEAENHLHTFGAPVAVTSFRPSVIFGPGDSFINRFAGLVKMSPGIFPLTCPNARFAPVYVGDVVEAFLDALEDRDSFGKRYDLCGPHVYTLKQIVQYTARVSGHRRLIIGLPDGLSKLVALLSEYLLPGKFFSLDNYHSLKIDSVCHNGRHCPTSLEAIVPTYLGKADRNARYQILREQAGR